jgi:protein SMG6
VAARANGSGHAHRPDPAARQLFDHTKDDPVRFSVRTRPHGRPIPTPKSSRDYISASSISSYAPSQASSFTLSSNTDGSSASSALFDGRSKPSESQSTNVFAIQLKKLYRAITTLETKVKGEDADENDDSSRVLITRQEPTDDKTEKEKWRLRLDDHKRSVVLFLQYTHTRSYFISLFLLALSK